MVCKSFVSQKIVDVLCADLSAHAEEIGALVHSHIFGMTAPCLPAERYRDGGADLVRLVGAHHTWIFLELSTLGDYYEFASESLPSPKFTFLEKSHPVPGGWMGSGPTGALRRAAFSFSPTSQWVSDLNGRREEKGKVDKVDLTLFLT